MKKLNPYIFWAIILFFLITAFAGKFYLEFKAVDFLESNLDSLYLFFGFFSLIAVFPFIILIKDSFRWKQINTNKKYSRFYPNPQKEKFNISKLSAQQKKLYLQGIFVVGSIIFIAIKDFSQLNLESKFIFYWTIWSVIVVVIFFVIRLYNKDFRKFINISDRGLIYFWQLIYFDKITKLQDIIYDKVRNELIWSIKVGEHYKTLIAKIPNNQKSEVTKIINLHKKFIKPQVE